MTKIKNITLLAVLFMASTYTVAQTYVEAKKTIPNKNLNQAIGEKGAIWYNSGIAPSTSLGYPNFYK